MKTLSPLRTAVCLLALFAASAPAETLSLRLEDKGITLNAGGMGQLVLNYPVLVGERWDQVHKPIEKTITGNTAVIKFDAGAQVGVEWQPATGELILTPARLPADVKTLRCDMLIDFNASGISILEKDLASALINFYYQTNREDVFSNYHSPLTILIFKDMIETYQKTMQEFVPTFEINPDLLRFFMAHYFLQRSGTNVPDYIYRKIESLLTCKDRTIDSALNTTVDYPNKDEYWGFFLTKTLKQFESEKKHYSLLSHAIMWFNLYGDPKHPLLEKTVLWQLLFASQSSDNGNQIVLHKDLVLDHLSAQDLGKLRQIIQSYCKHTQDYKLINALDHKIKTDLKK